MRIVFIGSVQFSERALKELIGLGANVVGVCTRSESFINSDYYDLSSVAKEHNIPFQYVANINDSSAVKWVQSLFPDVIFCFGWSNLIKHEMLSSAALGTIGYHPALLPANRGRHPLTWALVLGLPETASTFFFMDEGADSGDILSQVVVPINDEDDASSLYEKITEVALCQIRDFLPQLINKTYRRLPQDHTKSNYWRKRSAPDGLIDWRMAATSIYNLVRGLTKPYVGAHFVFDGEVVKVWRVQIVSNIPDNLEPGKVLAVDQMGIIVKTGIGAIRLLDKPDHVTIHVGDYL